MVCHYDNPLPSHGHYDNPLPSHGHYDNPLPSPSPGGDYDNFWVVGWVSVLEIELQDV